MLSKQIIMCVDDEQVVLTSLESQLRQAFGRRFDYETFTSAEEAYDFIDEKYAEGESISLIVTDWLMPKVRGDEFLVRVHRRYKDVPMIMLSGQADEKAVDRARNEAKLFKFLSKPWQAEELTEQAALAMKINMPRVHHTDSEQRSVGDPAQSSRPMPRPVEVPTVQQSQHRPQPVAANAFQKNSPGTQPRRPSPIMRPAAFRPQQSGTPQPSADQKPTEQTAQPPEQQPRQQPGQQQPKAEQPTPPPHQRPAAPRPMPMMRPGITPMRKPLGSSKEQVRSDVKANVNADEKTDQNTSEGKDRPTPETTTSTTSGKRPTPPPFMMAARKNPPNDS
ncbi:MAG: response regulator [Bacteroidota bacterium]